MRIITTIIFTLLAAGSVSGQMNYAGKDVPVNKRIDITGVSITSDGTEAKISFNVTAGEKAAKGNRMVKVAPVVVNNYGRYELIPIAVRGRGSYISQVRRARANGTTMSNDGTILVENGETLSYSASIPDSLLTPSSKLIFESDARICANHGGSIQAAAADFVNLSIEISIPETVIPKRSTGDIISGDFNFVEELPVEPVRFTDDMRDKSLVVYFKVDNYDLYTDYRNNGDILKQIISAVNIIKESDDSEISKVMLAGFASPEGLAERNAQLAERRSSALRNYITDNTGLTADKFFIHNGGSDWEGLRRMISESRIPYRAELLDIIENSPEWDPRKNIGRMGQIMKLDGGRVYQRMNTDFFPDLRNAAYIKVYYRNK